jgi:hypothetical protein
MGLTITPEESFWPATISPAMIESASEAALAVFELLLSEAITFESSPSAKIQTGNQKMFAASSSSRIYHLAGPCHDRTLCGLSMRQIQLSEPDSASYCLVENLPPDYNLCTHCIRLGSNEEEYALKRAAAN